MNSFILGMKEENKELEHILSFEENGGRPSALLRQVKEKFSGSLIDGDPENQPFLYIKVVPIKTAGSNIAASIIPSACFKVDVKKEMIEFINKNID